MNSACVEEQCAYQATGPNFANFGEYWSPHSEGIYPIWAS